ncbi:MAG TPA: NAD-dependent epimerase/dehydratase family protein [Candidatus Baltobacteraceae bacterium]|jgi:UDP-glucose 4-epimerase|nr:NAD-dependent epimerase/dehydratase family protein [Candidatus Baltobacteraceae bacterium]
MSKRFLITGGTGFIGSHLTDALLAQGHNVTALDNLETGSRDNVENALRNRNFELVVGDICDAPLVDKLARKSEVVVHLAARIGLKLVIESPLRTVDVNVRGTEAVMGAATRYRCRTIVASTSEVYGLATKIPSSEEDPITFGSPAKGRWAYACSKAVDEFLALALARERGLPSTVVRLFNTVGPRQSARYGMVLPRFVRQALANEPLTVYGDGTQTRSFCYVGDVVRALLGILGNDVTIGEVYNLGNPQEVRILDLAHEVIRQTGSSSTIGFVAFDEAYAAGFEEIHRRVPDITKLRETIDFVPRVSLSEIIASVIESVRRHENVA